MFFKMVSIVVSFLTLIFNVIFLFLVNKNDIDGLVHHIGQRVYSSMMEISLSLFILVVVFNPSIYSIIQKSSLSNFIYYILILSLLAEQTFRIIRLIKRDDIYADSTSYKGRVRKASKV